MTKVSPESPRIYTANAVNQAYQDGLAAGRVEERREAFERAAKLADEWAKKNHDAAVRQFKRGDDAGHDVLQACELECTALAAGIRQLAQTEDKKEGGDAE